MGLTNWTRFADFSRMDYDEEGMIMVPKHSRPSYSIEYNNREENPKENKI